MAEMILGDQSYHIENIYCVARNYAAHAAELNNQLTPEPPMFMKPTSALHHAGDIILPAFSNDVHYECELVALIGATPAEDADEHALLDCVSAYAVGLDLTARDVQNQLKERAHPWLRAKGFRHAACLSSFLPAAVCPDVDNIEFSLKINGELRQHGNTRMMLHRIPRLLAFLQRDYGLQTGDLIYTGTPQGVGRLQLGDVLEVSLMQRLQHTWRIAE